MTASLEEDTRWQTLTWRRPVSSLEAPQMFQWCRNPRTGDPLGALWDSREDRGKAVGCDSPVSSVTGRLLLLGLLHVCHSNPAFLICKAPGTTLCLESHLRLDNLLPAAEG